MLGISVDITERKQTEETQSRYAAIVESSDEAIISEDLDGIITSWNPGAERFFGYTEAEAVGRSITIIIPPELHHQEISILYTLRTSDRLDHHETMCVTKDGRRIFISLTLVPLRNKAGRLVGITEIARDITARKEGEIERAKMLEEIAYLNRAASVGHMAASLAHELAQPLAAILSNAQAAEHFASRPSPDLTEVRAALADIREDDERARAVVQNMHTIFRRQPFVCHELDLNKIVDNVSRLIRKDALLRGVMLRFMLPSVAVPVVADEVPLQQVVLNLITNGMDAMRDVPLDKRVLTISTEIETDKKHGIFVVQDNGPGIAEKDKPKLFTPFFTTKATGLGMGLSICRSILDSLGGCITFENQSKAGAAFRVQLPLAPRRDPSASH